MKKYIIEYELYDDILGLLGHEIPHSNLENVKTVIVDLTNEEYEALIGAGINIVENGTCGLLSFYPPDMEYRSTGSTYPYISDYLNLRSGSLAGFNGSGSNVALLDSGCQDANALLANPTLIRQDYTGLGVQDDNSHGSKGCMIISQKYSSVNSGSIVNYGMAYNCQLYSMRVLEGGSAAVISAIDYCISNNIHIINLSITVNGDITTAINAAINAGIIVVCASGNDLISPIPHPANISGVITVSCVDNTTSGMPLIGSYITSEGNPKVTIINYNGGYYEFFVGGTSQAAFMLTALMAIYKQKYPSLNTPKAINLLRRKALQMTGYNYNQPSTTKNTLLNYQTGAGFLAPIN